MNDFIDSRGKLCPIPIVMLKRALDDFGTRAFKFAVDNEISYLNVKRYLSEKKISFKITEKGKDFIFYVNKEQNFESNTNLKNIKSEDSKIQKGTVICLKTESMGDADKELGKILMCSFVNNLKNNQYLPEHIICYNHGALLCVKNSGVVKSLQDLEEDGVTILICGVCVEYFKLKNAIALGKISNMHEISEVMLKAKKIIYP